MAHSKSRRKQDEERRLILAAEAERARPHRESVARAAKLTVAAWNVQALGRGPLWFYPTIGAALVAKRFYLTCWCPACHVFGCIDLRTLDRHPQASLQSLIPKLSCIRCCPNPPFAKLVSLRKRHRWRRNTVDWREVKVDER